MLVRDPRRLGAVLHAELAVDVRQMELHGLGRDPELLRDLVVREAAGERAEDRQLALGEAEGLCARALASPRRRSPYGRSLRAPGVASPGRSSGLTVLIT